MRDLRYACRTLLRQPAFSIVAVLSLALGIGANTAIFSIVNAVMLRTLPVQEPERLVQIARVMPDGRSGHLSYPLFEQFRDNVRSISAAFAHGISEQAIVIDNDSELVKTDFVSGAYYDLLGLRPTAGRLLRPDDDLVSASPAVVISDRYWERRFGRSPSAIGRTIGLRDRIFTIVGVAPASYESARTGHAPDLTLPLVLVTSDEQRREVTSNTLHVMARLRPGATVQHADAELQVLWRALIQSQAAEAPEKDRPGILRQRVAALAAPGGINPLRDTIERPLLMLMGIVGLILMLACVNLSGLLLARAAARQREISIRLALGASRGRLLRQVLAESLVLAALGGGLGLVTAGWFSARLVALFADGRNLTLSVSPDWRVLAFTAAVSLAACVLAGLVPALQAMRVTVNPGLKEVRAPGHGRLGRTLVVAQISMSMVLVVGATLFVGSLLRLYAVDRGFDSRGLLVVHVRSSRPYPPERALAVQEALLQQLRALPDVRAASAAQVLPIGGNLWTRGIQVEGYAFRPDEPEDVAFNVIAPDYFATLGTPLIAGRELGSRDSSTAPKVAIVNESFARAFFGDEPALGKRVTSLKVAYEIVGVVRDAKYQSLRDDIRKTMYIPWMQREGDQPTNYGYLTRVAAGDPMRLVPAVERLVRDADPGLRVRTSMSYETLVDRSIATERIMATLGGLFGLLSLIVAALGMFGVLAFQVTRRTNEFGVRMALGASQLTITRLVLRDVTVMVLAGVALGAGLALTVTRLARQILFGLTPTDPGVFVIAASVLGIVALLAGWLPARRAAGVDPLVALRQD